MSNQQTTAINATSGAAANARPGPRCDHICLRDDGHVERGEPHFYGYEIPSPRCSCTDTMAALVGLRVAIVQAVKELDAEHVPMWSDRWGRPGYTTDPVPDRDPVGCAACYPGDSSWPCATAMVANDLRAALGSGSRKRTTEPPHDGS